MPEINEPEIVEKVKKEITEIGDNAKKQYDEIQKSFKSLKDEFDSQGKLNEKLAKIEEDIVTRQQSIDEMTTKTNSRMDDLEVAFKRPAISLDPKEVKSIEDQRELFVKSSIGIRQHVQHDVYEEKLKNITSEDVKNYTNTFFKAARVSAMNLDQEERKTMVVGSDAQGGYLVPPEMSNKIIQRLYEMDPIRQLANVETISSDSLEFGADWDDVEAGWVGETSTRNDTDSPNQAMEKIYAHEMFAMPNASQQLIEDASVDIQSYLSRKISDKFARVEAAAFVSGNGVKKPQGLLTYASGTGQGQVEQVNMGNASALTADGFNNIKYTMIEQYIDGGTWLMNRNTVLKTLLLKDGEGRYIWQPGLQAGAPMQLIGSPMRMSTTMPTVAANALSVCYANFKEAYTIVDRLGMTMLLDPYTSKGLVKFYTRKRVGGGVVNGQAIKLGKIAS